MTTNDNGFEHTFSDKHHRCVSMAEYQLMVRWVVGSIPYGRPTELFPIPANASQMV